MGVIIGFGVHALRYGLDGFVQIRFRAEIRPLHFSTKGRWQTFFHAILLCCSIIASRDVNNKSRNKKEPQQILNYVSWSTGTNKHINKNHSGAILQSPEAVCGSLFCWSLGLLILLS